MASNESKSKSHRKPVERSQNSSLEKAPFKSETPGAVGKRRVVQNSSRVRNSLMVTGSDDLSYFFERVCKQIFRVQGANNFVQFCVE